MLFNLLPTDKTILIIIGERNILIFFESCGM